jgi:DNA-binding LacI/PurR family transcriptional regulator
MPESIAVPTNIALVAKRIEADLRSRGLQTGDRYLTVSDAAEMLGVSAATAHRAMSLLVDRGLLSRHHGRGTFVGEGLGGRRKAASVRTVFVLLPEDQVGVTGVQLESIIAAIRENFRGVGVQFGFLPRGNDVDYVRELIGAAQRTGQFAGAIPISCSRAVYKFLADAGGPVVVLGSVYDEQQDLPSVDLDYRQGGYLLAKHLVRRGHTRMALLSAGEGRPGDNAFFDGVSEALTEAELPHNALVVRIYPKDYEAFRAQVAELLRREDRPTAAICGSHRFTAAIESVAGELNLRVPRDLELAFESQATADADRLPYVHVQPEMSFEQVAGMVARMLRELSDGARPASRRVVIPVVLRVP